MNSPLIANDWSQTQLELPHLGDSASITPPHMIMSTATTRSLNWCFFVIHGSYFKFGHDGQDFELRRESNKKKRRICDFACLVMFHCFCRLEMQAERTEK